MSICMPLGEDSWLETGARTPAVRVVTSNDLVDVRIGVLEDRLNRLEEGQRAALDLVRQALVTLRETQAEQNHVHQRAVRRLTLRLDECESSLARLDSRQRRDDEAMRERLFDISESLENVRATAAAAVRPGALRKLERTLGREIEACAGALRMEFGKQIAEAVEAAESRSAEALEGLEEQYWDDIIELARRFDSLADSVVKVRRELDDRDGGEGVPVSPFSTGTMETAPFPEEMASVLSGGSEDQAPDRDSSPDVIPFPPKPAAASVAEEREDAPAPGVGALLCAAASRVEAEEEPKPVREHQGPPRAFAPLRRVATSAGSAVIAVCVMGGLSLLAGPALGPNFQGAPPAFAHDRTGWSPVTVGPQPVSLTPHLKPVLRSGGDLHPVRTAEGVKSGH